MNYADFHSHILPGADHGSDSLSTSINQLKKAVSVGIDEIFATPHFYIDSDTVSEFLERREHSYNELYDAAVNLNIPIKIHKSCEVNLQMGLPEAPDIEKLCIENTNYMLLELPFIYKWESWVYISIDELRDRGIEPIIAHIDRYDKNQLERLFDYDVMTQINADSLMHFRKRHRIISYIEDGLVQFIGSDIHMDGIQFDSFAKCEKVIGKVQMKRFSNNAKALIKGEKL